MANETHRFTAERKSGVALIYVGDLEGCKILLERNRSYGDTVRMTIEMRDIEEGGDWEVFYSWNR